MPPRFFLTGSRPPGGIEQFLLISFHSFVVLILLSDCRRRIKKMACKAAGLKEKNAESMAESMESTRRVLNVAGLATTTKANDKQQLADIAAAAADIAAARKRQEEAAAKTAATRAAVASAAVEAMNLKPESYGDSGYWEQRHAKSREEDETYEWYTGYPDDALREVTPDFFSRECHNWCTILCRRPMYCHVRSKFSFLEAQLWNLSCCTGVVLLYTLLHKCAFYAMRCSRI